MSPLASFAGRYGRDSQSTLVLSLRADGALVAHPILWRGRQVLRPDGPDAFVPEERPEVRIVFSRDEKGRVSAVSVPNLGGGVALPRLPGGKRTPAERLVAGDGRGAARALLEEEPSTALETARLYLQRFPSRVAVSLACLAEMARLRRADADVQAALGDALVAAGNRVEARAAYRLARRLEPSNAGASTGLRKLGESVPGGQGWTMPFSLDALFRRPTERERSEVLSRWTARDLKADGGEIVAVRSQAAGTVRGRLLLVSHRVHGSRHHGLVFVPEGAAHGSLPILLEAKGVSWDYFPLEFERLTAPRMLGADLARFVLVSPGFRGETVLFDGDRFVSEGDRTDSWDGATDDLLALLSVVPEVAPEADPRRVAVFGRSRGGSVALLAGIRDPRISRVAAWSAPTDWFELMGRGGFRQREEVEAGLSQRAVPPDEGGQFIERYLATAIQGRKDLSETRFAMLAGSPLWFAGRLGKVLAIWGEEDEMVPVRNGRRFRELAERFRRPGVKTVFLDGAGHDLDDRARERTRAFLTELPE